LVPSGIPDATLDDSLTITNMMTSRLHEPVERQVENARSVGFQEEGTAGFQNHGTLTC
jgi:hypothetical protein